MSAFGHIYVDFVCVSRKRKIAAVNKHYILTLILLLRRRRRRIMNLNKKRHNRILVKPMNASRAELATFHTTFLLGQATDRKVFFE